MPLGSVVKMALVEERRFGNGFVFLWYDVKPGPAGAEG
jgi:hypothetical protein